ncbi:reverse transcriptase domain-containing protein [Tanacetum coccineum]
MYCEQASTVESNAYALGIELFELEILSRRYKRRCCSLILTESNSLPHTHTKAIKTYYKHQDSRIKKAQELNTKTSTNSDIQDLPKSYQGYQDNDCQGILLASFQDDAYEVVSVYLHILVAVDYVSKWSKAQALPTNDARVVITFLKKLFCRFGIPKALISDKGTHFCNKIMESTTKRILEKIVKDNHAIWLRKLNDALWAFRIAYKTPTGTTPYKLIYGKNYHLPFEIEHRAYWVLKNCNPYLITAGEKRMFQLHELDELRHQAYENSRLYKARTKV